MAMRFSIKSELLEIADSAKAYDMKADMFYNMSYTFSHIGDQEKVLSVLDSSMYYELLLKNYSNYAEVLLRKANILVDLGRLEEATSVLDQYRAKKTKDNDIFNSYFLPYIQALLTEDPRLRESLLLTSIKNGEEEGNPSFRDRAKVYLELCSFTSNKTGLQMQLWCMID